MAAGFGGAGQSDTVVTIGGQSANAVDAHSSNRQIAIARIVHLKRPKPLLPESQTPSQAAPSSP